MTPATPDLSAPRAALAEAQRVRDEVRGRPSAERDAAVRGVLGLLSESWTAEHRDYMRRGPQLGRTLAANSASAKADPVRVLRADMLAERGRLKAMLNRTSGTPRPPAPAVTAASLASRIARSHQTLAGIEARRLAAVAEHGRGSWSTGKGGGRFRSMHGLHAAADDLRGKLRAESRALRTAWERYKRTTDPNDPYGDRLEDLEDMDDLLRELRIEPLQEALEAMRRQAGPMPLADYRRALGLPAQDTWTRRRVVAQAQAFWQAHGRLPLARECHPDNGMPHYTQLQRALGSRPLRQLAHYVGES